MSRVDKQIRDCDKNITQNIENYSGDRGLLAQNILSQLRNLVEGVAFGIKSGNSGAEFGPAQIKEGMEFIKKEGCYSFLKRFHNRLQKSVSHYTFSGDGSERLMLDYYSDLIRLRQLAQEKLGINILSNLESFPLDLDLSMHEYYRKIVSSINERTTNAQNQKERYYIHKVKPFLVEGKVYYEVTFYAAVNRVSKFNRSIAFTQLEIMDNYAAQLTLRPTTVKILEQTMDILIIDDWQVSIRPCEFDNFSRIFGMFNDVGKVAANSPEYINLMKLLKEKSWNLLDFVDLCDTRYQETKKEIINGVSKPRIIPVLDKARQVIQDGKEGANVIRYLMLRMNNRIIKMQYNGNESCYKLSNLFLKYGCIPFDQMPYCTSLCGHNPTLRDLFDSIEGNSREHEMLARVVRINAENRGRLYLPLKEVKSSFGSIDELQQKIDTYNSKLYTKHKGRTLENDKDHLFLKEYEDNVVEIIRKLQSRVKEGMESYADFVDALLVSGTLAVDDSLKQNILKDLFARTKVALIYGAAGTGKSTMIEYAATLFTGKRKLFLANTHTAVDNMKHRVSTQEGDFQTIAKYLKGKTEYNCDLLVLDECSTVSNSDFLKVLNNTSFNYLLLVGDIYQIESIKFGNWFDLIRHFVPKSSVHELKKPFRTEDSALIQFWDSVRNMKGDITEPIVHNGYSAPLNTSLFDKIYDDEIVLCLNYDGLYGINNVNRFLQDRNKGKICEIGVNRYKIGDPILFNEISGFDSQVHNNLKGKIVNFNWTDTTVQFEIEVDKNMISLLDENGKYRLINDSTIQLEVERFNNTDEDDDSDQLMVPFQVAYAVSIHKAQGLEYDSVKIVITNANQDDISHNIFYTAITRARKNLRIFWTPETERAILSGLKPRTHSKNSSDIQLLKARHGLRRLT